MLDAKTRVKGPHAVIVAKDRRIAMVLKSLGTIVIEGVVTPGGGTGSPFGVF